MDASLRFASDKDEKWLEVNLATLNGRIKDEELLSLQMPPAQKLLQLKRCRDPRQSGEQNVQTLEMLSHIHEAIVQVAATRRTEGEAKCDVEALLTIFSLASVLILYFRRYDLDQETWGCQLAWMHLLRLRYHAVVRLYECKEMKSLKPFTEYLRKHFALARRDWINFCTNPDNHFLFSSEIQIVSDKIWPQHVTNVEAEVVSIVRPSDGSPPYDFYVRDDRGKRILDRIIADWFLRDRADWFTAVRLTLTRIKAWLTEKPQRKALSGICALVFGLLLLKFVLLEWVPGDINWVNALLRVLYPSLLVLAVVGLVWRTIMDLLLPRMWAGTAVGYLPLFLTSELWKLAYPTVADTSVQPWWGSRWWGLSILNVLAFCLAFFYIRWEVGNRLIRTPHLRKLVAVCRALWLTTCGWLVSMTMGFIIFDIAGAPMARACLGEQSPHLGTTGWLGNVHLHAVFLFAPFALLVGVILQIFWEDKPITQTA